MFDAYETEVAFRYFFGAEGRGGPYDADILRGGKRKELGELLEKFADHFQARLQRINFASADRDGKNVPRISVEGAIRSLKAKAADLKKDSSSETPDYHWEVIGVLVASIAALLDLLETKS